MRLPVFLARRPDEPADPDLRAFYERLLGRARATPSSASGDWQLGERSGWEGNDTWQNLVAWGWRGEARASSSSSTSATRRASGHVSLPWDDLRGRTWRLDDAADGERYERSGDDLRDGLYVALEPWALAPLRPDATRRRKD